MAKKDVLLISSPGSSIIGRRTDTPSGRRGPR